MCAFLVGFKDKQSFGFQFITPAKNETKGKKTKTKSKVNLNNKDEFIVAFTVTPSLEIFSPK